MRLRLSKLQELNEKNQKIETKSQNRYKKVNKVLYYYELLFILKII